MPEISIKAETLFYIGTFAVKNSMVLSSLVFLFFIYLCYSYYLQSKSDEKSGLYYTLNLILRTLYDLFASIVHDKVDVFFPLLSAFFLWILIQNWSGLLPGVGSITMKVPAAVVHGTILNQHAVITEANKSELEPNTDAAAEAKTSHEEEIKTIPLFRGNNADLNATLALAIISVTMIQVYGFQFLGFKTYISKFLNFKDPIYFVLGLLEVVSEISKVLSFAFRLFGNIFAGEVLLTIVAFLVPVLASFPFLILEVFVGFVQALVFSMLTSVFLGLAVSSH
ncbi:MAG: F0F1 ATP synthase subunit A [Candidatus Roizmanbacteria bacterium]|nr:F0F1 ATP synthase subunit A [Candidatus Roizmanbacteria bacterium]